MAITSNSTLSDGSRTETSRTFATECADPSRPREDTFVAHRVTDLERSPDFYTILGYVELGRVEGGDGSHLVILKFPGEPAASLELVDRPVGGRVDVGLIVERSRRPTPRVAASPRSTGPAAGGALADLKPSAITRDATSRHSAPTRAL